MKLLSIDFFEVGNAPVVPRRDLNINTGGSALRRFREIGEGVEQYGEKFLSDPEARRLLRDVSGFTNDGKDPGLIVGDNTRGAELRTVRDTREIFRYIAVLEDEAGSFRDRSRIRILVSGYTDRAEVDRDGLPDYETRMHINTVTTLRVRDDNNGLSRGERQEIVDNSMILLPDPRRRDERSEEVASPGLMLQYSDQYEDNEDLPSEYRNVDAHGLKARSLAHSVSSPDRFLGAMASSTLIGMNERQSLLGSSFYQDDVLTVASMSKGHLTKNNIETVAMNNKFLAALSDSVNSRDEDGERGALLANNVRKYNSFVLDDLLMACDIPQSRAYSYMAVNRFENLDYDAESWFGGDYETMSAYDVCHRIPDIMLTNLIKGSSFIVTNMGGYGTSLGTHGARVRTEFSFLGDINDRGEESYNIVPITGSGHLDSTLIDNFEQRIIDEVFMPLSNYGEEPLELVVHATLAGLTRVAITTDDVEDAPYIFRSFAEHRLNTCLSDFTTGKFDNAVANFSKLRGELNLATMRRHANKEWDTDEPTGLLSGTRDKDSFFNRREEGGLLSSGKNRERSGGLGLGGNRNRR